MKFKEMKWVKLVLGTVGALVAGGAIMLGGVMVGYPAISSLVGLAVAQSATVWNNVIDAAKGDGQGSGILGMSPYTYNGVSFDRVRGDIANGIDVDVTRLSGSITPVDAYANPTTANQVWSLGGLFNGTTWDRWRGQVSTVQGVTLFNTQTTGAATTAVVVTLAAAAGQRAHVYSVEGRCNTAANTSSITMTDGGTTVWSTAVAEVLAVSNFVRQWSTGFTGTTNSAVVITLAACAAGTGTLIVQADRF